MTVVPDYGRDYRSAKAVKVDWSANKDFLIADIHNRHDGKPINKEDAKGQGTIMARYNGLQRLVKLQ